MVLVGAAHVVDRRRNCGAAGRSGQEPPGSLREDAGPEWDADQRAEGDRVGLENVARAEALLG